MKRWALGRACGRNGMTGSGGTVGRSVEWPGWTRMWPESALEERYATLKGDGAYSRRSVPAAARPWDLSDATLSGLLVRTMNEPLMPSRWQMWEMFSYCR